MATFWMTELPGGGFAMGEAADETEARLMIESQQRGSVVLDDAKTSHGWAESADEGP